MIGVVIPAHNEEQLLADCLQCALTAASHPDLKEDVLILVVLDSCSDRSLSIARQYDVQHLQLQVRNVGRARAAGAQWLLQAGARWLSCTDADSRVPADWLVAQLAQGTDAVCGTVTVDCWSEGFAPQAQARYHDAYQSADEHRHVHGANLGISAAAYVRAGGFEALACHEDVQLVRQLQRSGASIAWSRHPQVITSGRLDSRARGGFGDYLQSLVEP